MAYLKASIMVYAYNKIFYHCQDKTSTGKTSQKHCWYH